MKHEHGMVRIEFPITDKRASRLLFRIAHIGSMEHQHPCIRPNGLEAHQIIFCTSGEGKLTVGGKKYSVSAGMGFYLRPGVSHEYTANKNPWTTFWILFDGPGVEILPFISDCGDYRVFYIYHLEKLLLQHKRIYAEAAQESINNQNSLSALCYRFLLDVEESIQDTPPAIREMNVERMEKVTDYLEKNYKTEVSLSEIAEVAGITPQYLCRLFQDCFHLRPMEYVLSLRMKEAKKLLVTAKEMTLDEIALAVGYRDTSYFCRMFKNSVGMTPREFTRISLHG